MARGKDDQHFSVDATKLVIGRAVPCDVFVYLPINERMVHLVRAGEILEALPQRLKTVHIRNSDRDAFEKYIAPPPPDLKTEDLVAQAPEARKAPEAPKAPPPAAPPPAPLKPEEIQVEAPKQESPPPPPEPVAEPVSLAPPPTPEQEKQAEVEFVPDKPAEEIAQGLLKPDPEGKQAMQEAKEMVKKILSTANLDPSVAELIDNPDNEHSTTVAIYTALFAMGMKKTQQGILQDLIIAALLHDVGMTQIPIEILAVPEKSLAPGQRAELEKHVELGLGLLSELGYAPNDRVKMVIQMHHEKFDGTGYPAKINSFRVHELAQILSFADLLDSICRGNYDGTVRALPDGLAVIAGIERQTSFPQYFNPDVLRKIRAWLSHGGADHMAEATNVVKSTKDSLLKAS